MTAAQLRRHLADRHDIPTRGLMYDQMTVLHQHDHRPETRPDHDHGDGPGNAAWAGECREFGCEEERTDG